MNFHVLDNQVANYGNTLEVIFWVTVKIHYGKVGLRIAMMNTKLTEQKTIRKLIKTRKNEK